MEEIKKYQNIIAKICSYRDPGKKMLQKLMYLVERKGINLNLSYGIHFYGPYSTKLDNALHILEYEDIINIDTSGPTHIISMFTNSVENVLSCDENKIVDDVLNNFVRKTPLELEALTTIDYVANTMLCGKANDAAIIDKVINIKGTKFTREEIVKELNVLKQFGYVN